MNTFVTVNFNTPLLVTALCSSIYKHHPQCNIVVFDNSTTDPLDDNIIKQFNINYYDNTQNDILPFDDIFKRMRLPIDEKFVQINKLGSAKHTLTIDWLLWNLPYTNIILMDSDTILKKSIDFNDSSKITVGLINKNEMLTYNGRKARILPYCQYFNLSLIRKFHIHYFNPLYMMGFFKERETYDTGAYFYMSCVEQYKHYCVESLDINEYIVHYKAGSWKVRQSVTEWLYINKSLWTRN